jgi:hypothetical protein
MNHLLEEYRSKIVQIITGCQMVSISISRSSIYQFLSALSISDEDTSISAFFATESVQTIKFSSLAYDTSPPVSL